MAVYESKITLLSETVLGAGAGVSGGVNLDVLRDENGSHFIKASTFKGLVREQLEWFNDLNNCALQKEIDSLLGKADSDTRGKLKFWDLKTVNGSDRHNETVRHQTAIDEETGVADDGSLRSYTVIYEGAIFAGKISTNEDLNEEELALLVSAVKSIKHIGTNRTRGKGKVSSSLEYEKKPLSGRYEVTA